jgi:predicted small lipoprotein YifL
MKRGLTALAVIALLLTAAACPISAGALDVPPDDLPTAHVGQWKVAFSRNGAMVAGRGDQWLFDVGLNYAMPGWKEWGTQVRRSAPDDGWKKKDGVLEFHGTLHDIKRVERFSFQQRVSLLPGGLRLTYEVTPLQTRKLREFGLVVHLPVLGSQGTRVCFWPGFQHLVFPEKRKGAVLSRHNATGVALDLPQGHRAALILRKPVRWRALDDRRWQLNTYRLLGLDAGAARALSSGEKVSFSFDLLLGSEGLCEAEFGPAEVVLDASGRIAMRGPDVEKRIEGGLLHGGSGRWLFTNVLAQTVAEKGSVQRPGEVRGSWSHGKGRATCVAELRKENGTGRLRFRLLKEQGRWPPDDLRLGFSVPASRIASLEVVADAEEKETESQAGGGRKAVLRLKNGGIWTLKTSVAWTEDRRKIAGTDCRIVSAPPSQSEDEALTWEMTVRRDDSPGEAEK